MYAKHGVDLVFGHSSVVVLPAFRREMFFSIKSFLPFVRKEKLLLLRLMTKRFSYFFLNRKSNSEPFFYDKSRKNATNRFRFPPHLRWYKKESLGTSL